MSETGTLPAKTHNLPPIVAPLPEEMSEDLKRRFPELDIKIAAFDAALATYPKELTLKDEDIAASLQDLLGQMKKHKTLIGAHKKDEKKPWDGLVKVVQNFFATRDEKVDALLGKAQPIHEAYLTLKKDEARRLAEEEAERQRKAEETARANAAAAAEEQRKAEEAAAEARRKEEEARLAAEEADRKRREAQERAALAEAEERRLAEEKRKRDRAEKDRNEDSIRTIRGYMKNAEKLHVLAQAEEATDADIAQLDLLIKHGGAIGLLAGPVSASPLLDEEQKTEIEGVRARLTALRDATNATLNKREQAKRERARKAAEEEEARQAELRRIAREEEDKKLADARAAREHEEAESARLRDERKKAEEEARTAAAAGKGAERDAKAAGKDAKASTTEAERAGNRATRVENRLENTTDGEFSRTRGELGTVGSLTGHWAYYITDEQALRAVCGPLGEHFMEEALKGAVHRWMGAHRGGFTGERVEPKELPGVAFAWEQGTVLRT